VEEVEVEVEAVDEYARVEGLDPQAFGAMHLAIPSKVEPVVRALSPTCAT
jgi:hypothetical protein